MARIVAAERTRREIIRLCGAGLDAPTLRSEVLRRLRTIVPIDAAFFASVDPATLLFTDATVDAVLQPDAQRFLSNELLGDDVNKFVQLARSATAVRTLGQATALEWEQSPRYRDILAPLALGDELRAALRTGGLCWGDSACTASAGACLRPRRPALWQRWCPTSREGCGWLCSPKPCPLRTPPRDQDCWCWRRI